jgi:hypoxanthine phosphoribosyltransferase
MLDKIYLSQPEVDEMISDLIKEIQSSEKQFSCVVGIANGGLNISKLVALALDLEHKTVCISYYGDGYDKRKTPIIHGNSPGQNCLVVDDLTDTGGTFDCYRDRFGANNTFAVLFWDTRTQKPVFYVREKPPNWIVFPWENENES